jgi:hypothetical protein
MSVSDPQRNALGSGRSFTKVASCKVIDNIGQVWYIECNDVMTTL